MRRDPGGTIALFPSDHHFRESSIFRATVDRALRLARICEDRLLLIGAPATYPEVEYGWIQPRPILTESPSNSLQYVSRFWEKPSLAEANVLQKNGSLWNTFITIGSSGAFLDLLAATVPHLVDAFAKGSRRPPSIGFIARSSRSIFRKKYFRPGRSVSWYCATARPVGRILAAHEELGTFSVFSNSVSASPRQIGTAS